MHNKRVNKSIISVLIAALVFTMLFVPCNTGAVYADTAPKAKGKLLEGVNIRKTPSLKSSIVTTLGANESVEILSEKFTSDKSLSAKCVWYYLPKQKGYIRSDLASISYGTAKSGKLNDSDISIRKGPGTSFDRMYIWNKGKKIDVVLNVTSKSGDKWYKIKYNKKYYYVSAQFVTFEESSKPEPESESDLDINVNETVPKVTLKLKEKAVIRKSCSAKSTKIKTVSKGKSLKSTYVKFTSNSSGKSKYKWYYVPKYKGYIRGDSVTADYAKGIGGKLNDSDISIRKGPSTSFDTVYTWNKGKKLCIVQNVISKTGQKWYKVKYNKKYYYVYEEFVSLTENEQQNNTYDKEVLIIPETGTGISAPNITLKVKEKAVIRKSCFSKSSKVKTLKKGSSLVSSYVKFTSKTSLKTKYKWYYIPKYKGYIRGDYVYINHKKTVKGTVKYKNLNVRNGAGTKFKRMLTWKKGKTVQVVFKAYGKDGKEWYKVRQNKKYYYVRSNSLGKFVQKPGAKIIAKGKTTDEVNLRKGPGSQNAIYKSVKEGTELDIYANEKDSYGVVWYKVKYDNAYYYVCSTYVKLSSEGNDQGQAAPGVLATGKTTDSLNLRTGPGTAYNVACSVASGTELDIYGKSNDSYGNTWYKVQYKNSYYYAFAYYVKITSDNGLGNNTPSNSYPVNGWTTDYVNARAGAGTSYAVKASFAPNTKLKLTGSKKDTAGNKWYSINFDGSTLYVSAAYITKTEPNMDVPEESENVSSKEFEEMVSKFPKSYRAKLRKLHEAHPTWRFTARNTGIKWSTALSRQCSNHRANLTTFGGAYRRIDENTYDFENHVYYGFDGAYWVAASNRAVAFYMDPRNWLTESGIFMFENMSYNPESQKESVVRSILNNSAVPAKYSSAYMDAGEVYNISPVYLASKTYLELGSSDFMVNGKYNGCYNVYNIGSVDSPDGSAAIKGLQFAAGSGSYGRPWNTLRKAILGGANYISNGFVQNNQHTQYYERFNVLNGVDSIGTHQYATAIHNAATLSSVAQSTYRNYGMLSTGFTFEIPVYKDMPSSPCAAPSEWENNNNYLDSLKVTVGDKKYSFRTSFNRFNTSYALKNELPETVKTINVTAKTNDSNATVTVIGNTQLKKGVNVVTAKVTSSSGLVRKYSISVTRK